MNYTDLLKKCCDTNKLKAQDTGLYEDIIETGFFRAGLEETDLANKNVLDLGAHIGVFSLLSVALGAKSVFAVEMSPDNFKRLVEFTGHIEKIRSHNWAAFDGICRYVYPFDKDTLCKANKTGNKEKAIPAFSLEEILDFSKFEGDDITLKMDIEGSEYDVLLSAPSKTIRRFSRIIMEVHPVPHDDGPAKNAEFLKEYLAFFGFEVVKWTPVCYLGYDQQGVQIFCKAIDNLGLLKFVRKS